MSLDTQQVELEGKVMAKLTHRQAVLELLYQQDPAEGSTTEPLTCEFG